MRNLLSISKKCTECSWVSLFVVLQISLLVTPVSAQHYEDTKMTAFDAGAYDLFGCSVAVLGDVIAIGARGDDASGGTDSGSVYVFRRIGSDWQFEQKLEPLLADEYDNFGCAVEIIDDMIIVGAKGDDGRGSAYVFRYDPYNQDWYQDHSLRPADNQTGDKFGCALAGDGRYLAIGASGDDTRGTDAGSVYIYEYEESIEQWVYLNEFWASDGNINEWFGEKVDMSGDYVVVGLERDNPYGSNSGSAYIFQRNVGTWVQKTKLIPADGSTDYLFGSAVGISNDTVIVGARWDWNTTAHSGSAYVYRGNGSSWYVEQKIFDSTGAAHWDNFGCAVTIEGDTAVIGAWGDDDNGSGFGSAYVYTRTGSSWYQEPKLFDSDGGQYDEFGSAVAMSGNVAIVCAESDSGAGINTGSACAFNNILFNLSVNPDPLKANQNATFYIENGDPNKKAYLVYSLKGIGSTYVNQLKVSLNLKGPSQAGGVMNTDSYGDAQMTLPVPGAGSGLNVWFQSIQYGKKTNVLATSIQK